MKTASTTVALALNLQGAIYLGRLPSGIWQERPSSGNLSGPWTRGPWPGRPNLQMFRHQFLEHLEKLDPARHWQVLHDAVPGHEPILVSGDHALDVMLRRFSAGWFQLHGYGLVDEIVMPKRGITLKMPPSPQAATPEDEGRIDPSKSNRPSWMDDPYR